MPERKVIPLKIRPPRSFTEGERFIDNVRELVLTSKVKYKDLAHDCKISSATVHNLASGKTKWPRPTTLFPILKSMRKRVAIVDE